MLSFFWLSPVFFNPRPPYLFIIIYSQLLSALFYALEVWTFVGFLVLWLYVGSSQWEASRADESYEKDWSGCLYLLFWQCFRSSLPTAPLGCPSSKDTALTGLLETLHLLCSFHSAWSWLPAVANSWVFLYFFLISLTSPSSLYRVYETDFI